MACTRPRRWCIETSRQRTYCVTGELARLITRSAHASFAERGCLHSDGHIVLLGKRRTLPLPVQYPHRSTPSFAPDLGLATHFSTSSPRLTTCCGSPAFHVRSARPFY
jgi:hypothetical protein